ncbi:MAG: hypothetical protein KF729_10675 [Sandaracinaceae bacterium]|nr:hypothetical protein [Sandaracinaceae bacterium]
MARSTTHDATHDATHGQAEVSARAEPGIARENAGAIAASVGTVVFLASAGALATASDAAVLPGLVGAGLGLLGVVVGHQLHVGGRSSLPRERAPRD